MVRLIRLVLLLVALGAVYLAQLIFDHRSVAPIQAISFGSWGTLEAYLPGLNRLALLSPEDLFSVGLIFLAIGSLGIGLLTARLYPSWIGPLEPQPFGASADNVLKARWGLVHWIGLLLSLSAAGLTIFVGLQIGGFGGDTLELQSIWLLSLFIFLLGSLLVDLSLRRRANLAAHQTANSPPGSYSYSRPESGWPLLLLLLAVAGLLFFWQLKRMPVRVDPVVANIGLQAIALLQGSTTALFHSGTTGLPMLAYVPSALAIWLVQDSLVGLRLTGVTTGLLTIAATWLLGCELFNRLPRLGRYGTLLEDDGRWIALLGATVVGLGHVTAHFSRLPVFLGPAAWGTLGLWLLLRGLRTKDTFSLGLSGMLIGLSSILVAGGFFYLIVAPIWWIGIWLTSRHWLYSIDGVGSRGFTFWLGGLTLFLLPFVSVWARHPSAFEAYIQSDLLLTPMNAVRVQSVFFSRGVDALLLDNMRLTLLTFNIYPNVGALFDFAKPFLNHRLAPLFFVGVGVLALNLDRRAGWLILSALGTGIIWASISLSAPFWPRLLPLLPIVGLMVAFALDRIRLTLMQSAGSWMEQTTVYLAFGLVVWASLQGWIDYYVYAHHQNDPSAHVGRAIQEMEAAQTALILISERESQRVFKFDSALPLSNIVGPLASPPHKDDPVVQFLAADLREPKKVDDLVVGAWPETLPFHSRILIQPEDRIMLAEIEARYGPGELTFVRNLRSDPILYIYDVTNEVASDTLAEPW